MKQVLTGSMILVVTVLMLSCGPKPQPVPIPVPEEEDYQAIYTPPWWHADSCQTTEEYLCARATMESKQDQFSKSKAIQEARGELKLQLEVKLEVVSEGFAKEIGLDQDADFRAEYVRTNEQSSSGIIQLSVPYREETRKNKQAIYKSWVLYKLLLNDAFLTQLKAIRSNDHLYTEFSKSEAFKVHEKKIEEYEQYKKDQGY